MWWKFFIILPVVFLAGLGRLWLDSPRLQPIAAESAVELAGCLPSPNEIPVTAAISLGRLPAAAEKALGSAGTIPHLAFLATGPVQIEVAEADLSKATGNTILLPPKSYAITKAKGSFEFRLQKQPALITQANAKFLLRACDLVRFGPAEGASYHVTFPEPITADIRTDGNDKSKKTVHLPVNATGTLGIEDARAVVPLQPLVVSNWLMGTTSDLLPVRASGQPGLSDVTIVAQQSGVVSVQSPLDGGVTFMVSIGTWNPRR